MSKSGVTSGLLQRVQELEDQSMKTHKALRLQIITLEEKVSKLLYELSKVRQPASSRPHPNPPSIKGSNHRNQTRNLPRTQNASPKHAPHTVGRHPPLPSQATSSTEASGPPRIVWGTKGNCSPSMVTKAIAPY